MIGNDYLDLRDVAEAANDPDHDDHAEAVKVRAAFIADGLASDADTFADYADNEATAIHSRHFEYYAQELADDIGAIPDSLEWPLRHIDWERAARELLHDYSTFTVDGHDYHVRAY